VSFAAIEEPESTHPRNNRHNTSLSLLFEHPTQNQDFYVAAIAGRDADTQYPTENAYLPPFTWVDADRDRRPIDA